MKRNIVRTALIGCLLLTILVFGGAALADSGPQLPKAGILPDSPVYFLDKLGKDIVMFFTFGNQAKAEKALQYAGEQLAEAKAEKAKGKDQYVAEAARGYDTYMQQVQDRLQNLAVTTSSDNLSERVALAAGFHLTVLDQLADNLTAPAAQAIDQARQVSVNGQEQALKALARNRAELALKIVNDNANAHLEQFRNRLQSGFSGNITDELNLADQLTQLQNQLITAAEEQGIDVTAIKEQLAQATSQRLSVLSQVYARVPEQAKQAISTAVGNSFERYRQAIADLGNGGSGNVTSSDNATSPATILKDISSTLREKLGLSSANLTPSGHSIGAHNP